MYDAWQSNLLQTLLQRPGPPYIEVVIYQT
jgi:hypothetical protein